MNNIDLLFNSKKYKLSEKRLFLIAIVQKTIYSNEYFKNNSSLRDYIEIFEKTYKLPDDEKFKDYLYNSRTALAARVCRLIIKKDDLEVEKELMDWHSNYYKDEAHIVTTANNEKDDSSNLLEDYINHRKGRE
ncbi:hypothetical protein [Bacillus cereus]|uniref:hypothetical protein n=1 Tax=Bacillus cereus TaxID=1396 RepID=UPI0018F59A0B|nr:hypothetical protein [Bacillus cereus]MBJ7966979.1 hypothetical protein [Bacillus cereus]MBJ8003376.1 hypothetical protein [Bacillus cereus]